MNEDLKKIDPKIAEALGAFVYFDTLPIEENTDDVYVSYRAAVNINFREVGMNIPEYPPLYLCPKGGLVLKNPLQIMKRSDEYVYAPTVQEVISYFINKLSADISIEYKRDELVVAKLIMDVPGNGTVKAFSQPLPFNKALNSVIEGAAEKFPLIEGLGSRYRLIVDGAIQVPEV